MIVNVMGSRTDGFLPLPQVTLLTHFMVCSAAEHVFSLQLHLRDSSGLQL